MSEITKDPIKCYFLFFDACKKGDLETVKYLCSLGDDYLKLYYRGLLNIPYDDSKVGPFLLNLELSLNIFPVDDIFTKAITHNHLQFALDMKKKYRKLQYDMSYENFFFRACDCGDTNIIDQVLLIKPKLLNRDNINYGLKFACGCGHLNVVQHLLSLYDFINIADCLYHSISLKSLRRNNEHVFKYLSELYRAKVPEENINPLLHQKCFNAACLMEDFDIANYILSLNINVNIRNDNDRIFISACEHKNLAAISYLCSICNLYSYKIVYEDRKISKIIAIIDRMDKYLKTDNECMICHESENVYNIKCAGKYDHYYCNSCFNQISKDNKCVFCLTPF